MNRHEEILARRYAKAFLNVYGDQITQDGYHAIVLALRFLKENREIITYFKFPRMHEEKKQAIQKLVKMFALPERFISLTNLLCKQQRLYLLVVVLKVLLELYRKEKGIMEFSIKSSHELSELQVKEIQQFLSIKTGKIIFYHYALDKQLIAGIRLMSHSLLWEQSIAQQLRSAEQRLRL